MAGWGIDPWGSGGGGGGSDTTPPSVSFSPPTNTPIDPNQIIQVTITDLYLKRVQLTAEYPNGEWEVIYMQGRFSSRYIVNSYKQAVTNGWRFYLRRSGNWPARPQIHCDPYDTSANEA